LKPSNIKEQIAEIRRRIGNETRAHERRQKVTDIVIRDLWNRGTFFSTPEGHFYFEKSEAPRLLPIEEDSVALTAMIQERYGINRAERREFEHILSGLVTEAHLNGQKVDVHRLAHYDIESGRLYVSRFNGWMYRLDGKQIRQISNGADDVFFWDDPRWQPYELLREEGESGLLESVIMNSANFSEAQGLSIHDQHWLFSIWCRSQFFSSIHPTKPILLVCGEKGGGKTLSLRKWLKLLFGNTADVTALERSKPDGFVAAICSSPLAVFDNVDERISWLADHLAQLATGVTFKRRKYYTTNQVVEFQPQCFVALTSRTPKFIEGRDDVLDRMLILQTERLEQFDPEQAQLQRVAKHRNFLWTELLRGLNKIVAALEQRRGEVLQVRFRMADFASFALIAASAEGQEERAQRILEKMETRRTDMLLAEEPVSICLEEWLEKPENWGRPVTSGDLNSELDTIAESLSVHWPYRNAHALGQRLSHISANLTEIFDLDITVDKHAKQSLYRFWPLGESEQESACAAFAVLPEPSAEAAAGFAGFTPG
jgi:hypothetical protein